MSKAVYSPLQAADVLAWECRQYFKREKVLKLTKLASRLGSSYELKMLNTGNAFILLYDYNDLEQQLHYHLADLLTTEIVDPKTHPAETIEDGERLGQFQKARDLFNIKEEVDKREKARKERRQAKKAARGEANK